MDRHRPALAILVSVFVSAGCGGAATGGSPASGAVAASPGAAATTQSAMPTATPKPTPTPRPTIPAGSLSLVGLGDSIPGALGCDPPCRSYVEVYGELASAALGKPVVVENLATNDGLESRGLRDRVTHDTEHRAALADADLITITIGNNDWQGPCSWIDHAACLAHGTAQVDASLSAILDEIATLRKGKPTAIRVTTLYDMYLGDPGAAAAWGFPPTEAGVATFHAEFLAALKDFNAMTCRVATSHGAVCVDLVPAFNGPKDTKDAGPLLGPDHVHPSQAGQDAIAHALEGSGFATLGSAP